MGVGIESARPDLRYQGEEQKQLPEMKAESSSCPHKMAKDFFHYQFLSVDEHDHRRDQETSPYQLAFTILAEIPQELR
jgi:hypothetical protein